MPIGILVNAVFVTLGGLLGGSLSQHLSENFKTNLTMTFGISCMGMGVYAITPMQNMPAVIFAIVIGTVLGMYFQLDSRTKKAANFLQKIITIFFPAEQLGISKEDSLHSLVTIIILFCVSGTGIYGSLDSGMTGNHSILISKSILDLFTAIIFACNLGYVVSVVAIPQFVIFISLFLIAKFVFPFTTPEMIADFKSCGGFLMLATGFRMIQVRMFPIADMIPAMILVMPFSWIWVNWVLPLI